MKASNLLGIDYRAQAAVFKRLKSGIVDIHSHLNEAASSKILAEAAQAYGITACYSMTPLEELNKVRSVLGDFVRFIAVPRFRSGDPLYDHGAGYADRIKQFASKGRAKIAKFFCGPRLYDSLPCRFAEQPLRLDSPLRQEPMRVAAGLGMCFMLHVADPDTWFATKYADANKYGTKLQQYEIFEVMLDKFRVPTIAAHMGGYVENLDFLSGLLERHSHLYLDCSATKWIVRELSKHPTEMVRGFFKKWRGRILFGSDLVAAGDQDFDSYASRYWALRTLFETDYVGPSPIADPDLAMVWPEKFGSNSSPELCGKHLDDETLQCLYHGAAAKLLGS